MSLKLVPRQDEAAKVVYERYSVGGYPTLLFLDPDGEELDRLVGFLPADRFLHEVRRVRAGDTFAARLARLQAEPGDPELLKQVVEGLLERADYRAAHARIDAFRSVHPALEVDPSLPLELSALGGEHGSLYRRVARHYRDGWKEPLDLTGSRAAPALAELMSEPLGDLEIEEQADRIRRARHEDAGRVLARMPAQGLSPEELQDAARFAFDNGHYDTAAALYLLWHHGAGDAAGAAELNAAAWNLYLCRRELGTAERMARAAVALDDGPNVLDTLARVLYVNGAVDEAIEAETRAADGASGDAADQFREVVERMRQRLEMEDRPEYETYPG